MNSNKLSILLTIFYIGLSFNILKAQTLNSSTSRSSSELPSEEDLVISAPKIKGNLNELLTLRRKEMQVSESLSADQMKLSGDSDSAQTLKRVTGLTLLGGKYIYVRGLGERYSSVLLNQQGLPSPEPARRIIPLDLFPISLLESLQVKKSYSTDLPAEFGGGIILLKTKSIPAEPLAQVKIGLQTEDNSTFLHPTGSSRDWTGLDNGYRDMPINLKQVINERRKLIENVLGISADGLDKSEISEISQSLKNNYNLYTTRPDSTPSLQLALGNSWGFEDIKIGTLHALSYNNTSESKKFRTQKFNAKNSEELVLDESGHTEAFEQNIKRSWNSDFGLQKENHRIHLNYLNVLDTTSEAQIKNYSVVGDSVTSRRKTSIEWTEKNLERRQLSGEHSLSSHLKINWRGQNSLAKRNSPDYKEYTYLKKSDSFELNTDTTGNRRNYEFLTDASNESQIDIELAFLNIKIKTGILQAQRNRYSDIYRFHFKNKSSNTNNIDLTQDFDSILNKHKGENGFELMSVTDSADSYSGEQNLHSRFIWTESQLTEQIELGFGFREEVNKTIVRTFYYYDPESYLSKSEMRNKDLLPAASLALQINSNLKTRLAYSKTLARADFRELSTAPYLDNESGFETIGNPTLKTTIIENWDHRYEYFWKDDEFVSAGIFYKKFQDPIESQFEPSPNLRKTFNNSPLAVNQGIELESRTNLRYIDRSLRHFSLSSNLSLIDSKVNLGNEASDLQTSKVRPLQGQSPYVFNLQLAYENKRNKLSAAIIYNQIGKRITEVGTQGRPDIYELDSQQLDFNSHYNYSKSGSLNLKIKNLTDPEYQSSQGTETVKSFKKGVQIALNWSYLL